MFQLIIILDFIIKTQAYYRILTLDIADQMNPSSDNKNQMFKEVYKSAIRASYFGGIQNPEFAKKSKIQMNNIAKQEQKEVDQKTFRMMKGFKRPDQSYKVSGKKGNVNQSSSGFLCFSKTRPLTAQLYNTKFSLKNGDQIYSYVDFNAVSCQVLQKGNKLYITFQELPKQKCIQFEVKQKDQHKSWANQIHKIIGLSTGAEKHYTYLARKTPNFYRQQHILNSQFQAKANTGDIILFRSPHGAARAQRLITNSEYDHVGVILRNKKNQLFIFESTSSEGVGLTPWKHMLMYQWYNQTQKVSWRPLNITLADYEIEVIQAFVAKTLGKQFELNMNKLFQFSSKLQRSKQDQEKKTYFCSELVARLYKELKLIDAQKASTTYYPIDFSDKGNLKFIKNGVTLGNQKIIAFQKN